MRKISFKKRSISSRRKAVVDNGEVVKPKRRWRFLRFLAGFFVVLLGLIVIAMIAIPHYALYDMNKRLANMPEYYAHIDDLEINFFKLSAKAKRVVIKKKNGKIDMPIIYVSESNVTLDMDAWRVGKTATAIVVDTMIVNIVKGPTNELSQMPNDSAFSKILKEMMPMDRNKLEIKTGTVTYYDNTHIPNTKIQLTQLNVKATNLLNVADSTAQLPGRLALRANLYGATLNANIKVDAVSKTPKFDLTATLSKLNLVNVNHLLKAYAKFDVTTGYFSMSTELATKNNRVFGYIKPMISELKVFNRKEEKDEDGKTRRRERWIDFGAWLFKNKQQDKLSTTIEIDGPLQDPNINVWQIIGEALTQSTTKSLLGGLDNSVNINSVGDKHDKPGFLERIMTKKPKEEKPKKESRKEKRKNDK